MCVCVCVSVHSRAVLQFGCNMQIPIFGLLGVVYFLENRGVRYQVANDGCFEPSKDYPCIPEKSDMDAGSNLNQCRKYMLQTCFEA